MKVNKVKQAIIAAFAAVFAFVAPTFAANVAKVGNTEYATIDEAIAAWGNNTTLTLLDNVTLSDVIKLSSQQHHYLALGTFTLTAASGKDVIEIESHGRDNRSESGALTITADATTPGGIDAGTKACITYKYDATLASEKYDRPIVYIKGGVFAGSSYSGIKANGHNSAQDKCATFNISGGTFDCGLNLTKSKLVISGGTFNGSVSCTGGGTSHRLISGGTFKSFGFMTADADSKFGIGTALKSYDVGTYIDDNGYLVVGGPVVTEAGNQFEASSANYSGFNSYLQYSSAKDNGLYYTSIEEAIADNNKTTGSITVYPENITDANGNKGVLDLTGISYKGAIVVPEGKDITISNAPSTLKVQLADGTVLTPDANGTVVTKINVATLAELQTALASDSTLPIVITETIVIPEGETVELDLNGKTVNGDWADKSAGKHIYALKNYGVLTITDSSEAKSGAINSRGIYNYASLTLKAGAINAIDGNGGYAVNNQSGSTFVMNGGVVAATYEDDYQSSSGGYDATALNVPARATATLNGGKIINVCDFTFAIQTSGTLNIPETSTIEVAGTHGAIAVQGGATTIDAGKFSIPADEYSRTDNVLYVSGGKLVINGGTFTGDSDTASGGSCLCDTVGTATVNGGNFSGSSGGDVWGKTGTTIKGGTFSNLTETQHIADGYELGANGQVGAKPVAKIGETTYTTLAEALAAAQAGNEIVLLADVAEDVTVPADVIFNGNGKQVGVITAAGTITFKGVTKATNFGTKYTNTTVNIGEGACLEITGTGRLVIGHGCTFNITGTIADAKTADKAALTPSLVMPGASFTGAGVTFNVKNAYITAPSSYCSSSKSASGTFDFNIENSIIETAGKLAFESQSTAATVNFELKNSVLNTGSHLVFGVSAGEVVVDNSNVNVGKRNQIENRSTMTIKNGSVVNGAVATSSNAINPGTIIVENATYDVTGQFSGAAEGTGTLIIKQGANVSVGSIVDKANIQIDATGMTADEAINFTSNLSKFTGTVEVINNDKLDASIVDGKIVLALKPVAQIGEETYTTLEAAFAAATEGQTITLLMDATPALTSQRAITKAAVIDLNGKTLTLTEDDLYFGTTTFQNGNIVVDPSVNASTAVFWMFEGQTITFNKVKLTATGVTGTYLIGINGGSNTAVNLIESEIVIDNDSIAGLSAVICDNGTDNNVVISKSTINVENIEGRFYLGGSKGDIEVTDSTVVLNGVKEGFYLRAGQSLDIAGNSTVNIVLNSTDGRHGINVTDLTATYTKADTATVNASVFEPPFVAKIGSAKYASLQAAINAAVAMTGDVTIEIMAGTYPENINLTNVAITSGNINARPNITFKPVDGNEVVLSGTVTLGYREQNVGASMWNGKVTFEGITFNHAEDGQHSLDIQDVKGIFLVGCKVVGDGEYGIGSNGGNATTEAKFTSCIFENGAMQVLGQLGAHLVVDNCACNDFSFNVQGGTTPGLTIKNTTFNLTLTDAHVGESFYAVRSNANPVNIEGCKVNVDSTVTSVAADQTKWAIFYARRDADAKWNVTDCEVNLTDAAKAQIGLMLTKNDATTKGFERITITGLSSSNNNVSDLVVKTAGCATINGVNYKDGALDLTGMAAMVGSNPYKTLKAAVEAVEDNGTITLLGNVTITEATRTHNSGTWYDGIYYVGDKSFTIDFAGFTVTQDGSVNDYLLNFKNGGSKANTITLKNGTIDAGTAAFCAICTSGTSTQKITINLEQINVINNVSNGSTIKVRGGAELNVKSGAKITGKDSYLAIECVASTVNIYDGAEIYMNGTSSYNGCLVGACGNGVVNVYGGYGKGVKGGFIAMTSGGTINVSGGEWIANTNGTIGNNSNLYVLTAQNNKNESGYVGASVINVTGGTFRGGMDAWILNDANVEKAELNIAGGNFNANPTAYLDEGYVVNEVSGVYTVAKAIAKIGDTFYTNLVDAFKAATEGCTIEILEDVTIDYKWDCRDYATNGSHSQFKEAVTINGNGHTLKFTGTVNDTNWNTIFRFEENATVNNLTVDISEATGAQRVITAKKSLTVDGLTIVGSAKYGIVFGEGASAADLAASEIVVKNSTLTGTRRAISDNEGGKDVKSVVITDNTLNANVAVSASESITFNNNTAEGEVDLRSYSANNVLRVEANGNTLKEGVKNYIYAKTINAQAEFTTKRPPFKVATKAELNAALAAAQDGDVVTLTADIDYGTDQLALTKAITLDLSGKTLTTRNAWGGMSVKNNPTVKNGTIVHASNTAAIKVWNATAFEDLVVDVQGKGDANKTIGGIVLQSGSTTRVGSIKNVTIKGAALTNGIETYNCGDATENVIGSMEKVTINAQGTGMLISAPCGTATNCDIKGGVNGVEIFIKGNYSASLDLVNSKVEGGVYAHDEFSSNPGVVNNGTLSFTADAATTGADDVTLTLNRAENIEGVLASIKDDAQAKVGATYYATLEAAFAAAKDGETITLLKNATPALTSQKAITKAAVIDLNGKTLTLTEDDLYFGTTTFQNGNIVVDPSVRASTAVFWMFEGQTLTFNKVKLTATGVTGTYLIGTWKAATPPAALNIIESEIIVQNDSPAKLSALIADNGTRMSVVIDKSTINVKNLDGRLYLGHNDASVTVTDSTINLDGVKEGFYLRANQTLAINGNSNINITLNDDTRYGINITDPSSTYTKAESATVNATLYKAPFKVSTYEELIAALAEDNAYVVLANDITATATQESGYGKAGIVVEAGDVLDGNGKTLTIKGANATWDCVIAMKGGEVKNLTIAGAMRGVFMPGANGDVVIDNCKFQNVIYTFNSDAGSKDYTVTIKNTELNGWTSFSDVHKSVTFENCSFAKGNGYAYCRPYQATTFKDCSFSDDFAFDCSRVADNKLAFNGCTYNGQAITSENAFDLFGDGAKVLVNGAPADYTKVAQVGGQIYSDLQEAIKAAAPAGTVTLLKDVVVDEWKMFSQTLTVSDNSLITLNMNGLTINGNGHSLTVNSISSPEREKFLFQGAENLTVSNLTITVNAKTAYDGGIGLKSGTIENVTFNGGRYAVLPGTGDVTVKDCTFNGVTGYAVYFEEDRDNLEITGNTFNCADGAYAVTLRGAATFTDNTVVKGKVNLANSAKGEVSGNNFGTERFKVYNGATATITGNTINNLVFNDATVPQNSTFTGNTLSTEALAVLDAMNFVVRVDATYYVSLQAALNAAVAGTGNVTVDILGDIDLTGTDWNPVTVSGPGYPFVTVNGNNKTIKGLNDMLFAGTWAGKSGLVINNLTIADSTIVHDENDQIGTVGVGAFVGYPSASQIVTLNNCCLTNSTVKGGHWTGGLVGAAGGWSGKDGPVFMNLTIQNCSVIDSTVTGKGSAGAVIGHAAVDAWTQVTIVDTVVTDNTISSTGNNKAGVVMGTIGVAGQPVTVNGVTNEGGTTVSVTESGNTATSNGKVITTIYGRQGSVGGELLLTGGTYANNPVETGVDYVLFPSDEYGVKQNADGTWGVNFKGNVMYIPPAGSSAQVVYRDELDNNIPDGYTAKLLADITVAKALMFPVAGRAVTLDLNGKTLTNNSQIVARGVLTIVANGGKVEGSGTIAPDGTEPFIEKAPTVIADAGITVTKPDGATQYVCDNSAKTITTFVLATVDEVNYYDIREAIAAAKTSGKTLKLNASISLNSALVVDAGETLAINLNGKKITGKITDGALVVNNGTLKLNGGTIDNGASNDRLTDVSNNGIIAVNGTTIKYFTDNAEATIAATDGSTVYCTSFRAAMNTARASDTVTLLKNVEISELIKIEKAITLDLGGKSVTASSKKAFEVYAAATIRNGSITAANRCVDTRKNVALVMEDLALTAVNTNYGNPQPLTIGGSENGTTVAMTGVEINAGDIGYGIITFVQAGIAATNSTVSGYSALYVKPGSDNSEFEFVKSELTGTTGSNDVEGNSFSTIAIRADNVDVLVDAESKVTAKGGYMYALSLGGTDAGGETVTDANVIIEGEIVGTNILAYTELADNVVCVKAEYADELATDDYVVEPFGTDLVKVLGTKVAQVNGVNYASISAALAAAQAGNTVTIFAGTYNQALNVNKAITIVGERDADGNNLVSFNGKLNVTADGATVKNINVNNGSNSAGYISAKDVLIEGCSVVGGNGFRSCYTSGTVTFKDSTITGATYGIHFDGSAGGDIVIDNCVITGWTSFAATIKKVAVKDTIFAEGNYNYVRFYQEEIEIDGCTFNKDMTVDLAVDGAEVTVKDSTLENGNVEDLFEDVDIVKSNITVDDERLVRVAKIGNTYFETFGEAFAAAQAGDTITILAGDYTANLAVNKAITVVGETDAAGKNLVNITGRVSASTGATVKNLNVHNEKTGNYDCAIYVDGSNIVIDGCQMTGYNGMRNCYAKGNVTIKNSTITGSYFAVHFDGSNGGNLTIENCDITGWVSYGGGIDQVTLKDSTFDAGSYAGQRSYADTLVVEGCEFEAGYKLDVAVEDSTVEVTDSTMADGSSIVEVFNKEDMVSNSVIIDGTPVTYVAKIGTTYYATLEEALANVATWTTIKLVADATLDYGAGEVYGRDDTTDIIIDGQGFTLTLNQMDSDWSSIGLRNADGKLTLKNMTIEKTGYGDTSGSWNTHAIIFSSNVEMNNVTVNNGIAVSNGATLKDVTINEANGYYGLWIEANAQTVTMNGGAINATNGGRGIKIADEYIDAPAKVTLNVTGTKFNTAKKAAVLVSSKAGADITASNVNITNVAEDKVNFAWVDDGWATYYGKVAVTGGTLTLESGTAFVASLSTGDKLNGYYKTLADAVAAAQAGDTITLLADVTASKVIELGKSLTINGAGHKVTSSATRVFRVTTSGVEVTLNDVNMVSETVMQYPNDIRGISIDPSLTNVKLTLNECSVDFTDATACDWAYAVNVSGNGTGHEVTVNGGTYEGANVVNAHGVNNTITVAGATLNSLYPNNDEYWGACIWVLQNQGSSVIATNNTFNGANAVAFNLGTGTALTASNNIDNTTRCVAKIGNQYYTSLEAAFAAAQDGDEVKILIAGTYALSTSGKNITITGAVDGVVFDNIGAHNMGGASMTFNNVTFDYYPNVNYTGLQHSGNLVYNNCTINGQVFLYGDSETFNSCVFNQEDPNSYNVWTYSADPVEFNDCTFNCAGKSVLIYKEGGAETRVSVKDSTFNASASVNGKAAIEIDSSSSDGINLTITGSTATGFDNGNISGNSLWNNKMGQTNDANNDITVVVDGATVLAPVTFVAQIGNVKYASLQAAVNAAQNGETVTVIEDIELIETLTIAADKQISLDLNGKVVDMEWTQDVKANHEMIHNYGNLTIQDAVGGGKLSYKYTGGNLGTTYAANTVSTEPGSVLTVKGGTIENLTYDRATIAYAIDGRTNGGAGDVAVNIEGGNVTSLRQAVRIFANSTSNTGALNISGGEMVGRVIVQSSNANANKAALNITGGTFNANAYKSDVLYVGGSNSATIDIAASVSGGTFNGEITETHVQGFISGGTYKSDVSDYCSEGYAAAFLNGVYEVKALPASNLIDAGRGVVFENCQIDTGFGGITVEDVVAAVAVKLEKSDADAENGFKDYLVDFYVTVDGLPDGGVWGDEGDYIVGSFGPLGNIKVSLNGEFLVNGMTIPVLDWAGKSLKFSDFVGNSGDFTCGINFAAFNDGLKVTFTAGLAQSSDAETYIPFGGSLEYDLSMGGAVAIIEPNYGPYYSIREALMYAGDGDTIKLLADTTEKITIPEGLTVTINLNTNQVNGSILAPNANLTVKNGTIVNENASVSALEINAGTLNLENVNIDSARHALRIDGEVVATINGGTYRSGIGEGTGSYHALNVSGAAKVTIKGGTFVGPEGTTANSGAAVCVQFGSTVTIEGGNFSGGKNVTLLSGGTLKVEGGTYNQDPSAYLSAGYATYAAETGFGVMKSIKLDIKVINNEPVIGYAESDMVAGGKLILKATSTLDGTVTWTTITWTKDDALSTADGAKDWVKPVGDYRFFTGGVAK